MNKDEQGKLHQEVSQSNKARQLLDNPLFKEALDELKKLYAESLFNTGAKEQETREKLWLAYNVVGKVEQHIKEILDTGKLAKKQLEDFRTSIKNNKFYIQSGAGIVADSVPEKEYLETVNKAKALISSLN